MIIGYVLQFFMLIIIIIIFIPIRPLEIKKMTSEAAKIGKYILQLPQSTSNVKVSLLAGTNRIHLL